MATPIPSNEARFTLAEIARATGGTLHGGDAALEVSAVCTDSRAITARCLFVALVGENHDGHGHVAAAEGRGAAAVLARRGTITHGPRIEVDDTLVALGRLGRAYADRVRAARSLPSIAITGSAGKTTTKELTAAAVRAVYGSTLATRGNLNNLVGVPMTLFTLADEHRAMVIECGTNARGEIARLGEIVAPDVGVVLNADAGHTAGIGGIEDVAIEKGAMFEAARRVAIGNADDAPSRGQMDRARGEKILFGQGADADVRLVERTVQADGTARLRIALPTRFLAGQASNATRERIVEVTIALPGLAPAIDTCAALAAVAAMHRALSDDHLVAIAKALAEVRPTAGRFAPAAWRDAVIVDDTYNANPRSVRASIATAREMANGLGGRLVVVLGDMLELGGLSERLHTEMGEAAADAQTDVLVVVGAEMAHAARAARGSVATVIEAATPVEAARALEPLVKSRDVVLVKGSRGMRMEGVIAALGAGGHEVERVGP